MEKPLTKGAPITGSAREKLGKELRKKYDSGSSVQELVDETGRSYGFVHRLLEEYGVKFRERGGNTYIRSSSRLSRRQRDFLYLMAQGMTNAEVAATLKVRISWVYVCVQRAAEKLGSAERPRMVHLAYMLGELDPPKSVTTVEITADERRVLQELADGKTPEEIAASTGGCANTVHTSRQRLMARLGAKDQTHLITRGWEMKLLGPEEPRAGDRA